MFLNLRTLQKTTIMIVFALAIILVAVGGLVFKTSNTQVGLGLMLGAVALLVLDSCIWMAFEFYNKRHPQAEKDHF